MINGYLKERYVKIQLDIEVLDEILEKYGADTLILYTAYCIFENYKLSSIIKKDTVYKRNYVTDTDIIKYLKWTPRRFYRYKQKLLNSGYISEDKDKITSVFYAPNKMLVSKDDNTSSPLFYVEDKKAKAINKKKARKIKPSRQVRVSSKKPTKEMQEHLTKVANYCEIHKVNFTKTLTRCPLCKLDETKEYVRNNF